MAAYTFPPAVVLIEATGDLAVGAIGVLRPAAGGAAVQVYDLNGSPLPSIAVGSKGVHQPFMADIPNGILDFGSVLLPAISLNAMTAALDAAASALDAEAAASAAEASASSAQDAVDAKVSKNETTAEVVHDGTAGGGVRPAGYRRVRWIGGTTRPTNMAAGDIWEHDA